nr:hypothetical protein [Mangrovicoccus ximenensis]
MIRPNPGGRRPSLAPQHPSARPSPEPRAHREAARHLLDPRLAGDEGHVERARRDLGHQLHVRADVELGHQLGQRLGQLAAQHRPPGQCGRADNADGEAAPVLLRQPRQHRLLHVHEALGEFGDLVARPGQAEPRRVAVDQLDAEFLLESADPRRNGRLGQADPVRHRLEGAEPGQPVERLELLEVHRMAPCHKAFLSGAPKFLL